jgi:hypothetical protein
MLLKARTTEALWDMAPYPAGEVRDAGSLHALVFNGTHGLCHRTHKEEVSFYVQVLFHVCFLSLLTFVYKRDCGHAHKKHASLSL